MWVVLRAAIAGMLLAVLAVTPTVGVHTTPQPVRWWWDLDNDRFVDEADSNIGIQRIFGGWTQEKITSFVASANAWSGPTRWDPFSSSDAGGVHRGSIRVDGNSYCGWEIGEVAITCIDADPIHEDGQLSFFDMVDADIAINLSEPFYFGSLNPGANQYDFRGVITHELGHVLSLDHTNQNCGNPVITMCVGQGPGQNSKDRRSLEADDRNAANLVYPV